MNVDPAPSSELLQDLVDANHILFNEKVVDAFGHVSVRHDKDPSRFLLARNMAPGLVTADDIIQYQFDGTPIDPQNRRGYLERFIHGSIYRARPDVVAVVHSHSPTVVAFSVSSRQRLRPICHMSGFLRDGAGRFEIRDTAGSGTDLLIKSTELGDALAVALAERNAILMRGHGSTVVAPSLRLAVYRAVYAEINAKLQAQAIAFGEPEYLTVEEAREAERNVEGQVDRPWNLWKAAAQAAR